MNKMCIDILSYGDCIGVTKIEDKRYMPKYKFHYFRFRTHAVSWAEANGYMIVEKF